MDVKNEQVAVEAAANNGLAEAARLQERMKALQDEIKALKAKEKLSKGAGIRKMETTERGWVKVHFTFGGFPGKFSLEQAKAVVADVAKLKAFIEENEGKTLLTYEQRKELGPIDRE